MAIPLLFATIFLYAREPHQTMPAWVLSLWLIAWPFDMWKHAVKHFKFANVNYTI